jgi:hypothetical protein
MPQEHHQPSFGNGLYTARVLPPLLLLLIS